MKKIYQIIMICAMGIALVSCGGGRKSDSKKVSAADYRAACEQGDFLKAYSIVDEIKLKMQEYENSYAKDINEGLSRGSYAVSWEQERAAKFTNLKQNFEDAEHYVVLQECTYILESLGFEGLVKIAMTVKEHKADWVYKDLIDIAVAMDNEALADRLRKLAANVAANVAEDTDSEE